MDPIQTAISEIASLPDLHPETKTLLALAAEAQRTGKMPEIPGGVAFPASPCPDCQDSGYAGDQGPGSLYFRGRPTGNAEYVPCDCDPQARAARNLRNAESCHGRDNA